jgi:hypothetical protein
MLYQTNDYHFKDIFDVVFSKEKYRKTSAKKSLESTKAESQESFHYTSSEELKGGGRESKDKLRSWKSLSTTPLSFSLSFRLQFPFFTLMFVPLSNFSWLLLFPLYHSSELSISLVVL